MFIKQREYIFIGLTVMICSIMLFYIATKYTFYIPVIANTLFILLLIPLIGALAFILASLIAYLYLLQTIYQQTTLLLARLQKLSKTVHLNSTEQSKKFDGYLHYISQILHIPTNILDIIKRQISRIV